METKHLPPEIVAIIREYSKPLFHEYQTYQRALQVHHRKEWPKLKQLLMCDPEKVKPILLNYEQAQQEWIEMDKRVNEHYRKFYRQEVSNLYALNTEHATKKMNLHLAAYAIQCL